MGRSNIIPRIIRVRATGQHLGPWKGPATQKRLETWREQFNRSLKPGGANEHLGIRCHLQRQLEIYDQRTHQVITVGPQPPIFEIV